MNLMRNPGWIEQFKFPYREFKEIPISLFEAINVDLTKIQNNNPLISIIIAAWNEETNILNCVASLAKNKTKYSVEIIVVDNNSSDKTSLTIKQLQVKFLFQPIQGCGPARQLGQEHARGKYILLADADCIYPEYWIDEMTEVLKAPGVSCVYGRYSFIAENKFPRWKLYLLERMKDIIAEVKHIKRPYLNAYGISMGYVKEFGLKAGYIMHNTRGDDGRLCFDLMQFGKIRQVKANRARPWTGPRTLQRDGSFSEALLLRIKQEGSRLLSMLTAHPPHDTKKSQNS